MRRGRVHDTTAETVAGNALGDAVLTSVLSRIEDANERTVLLAHVALDLPVPAVARAFALEPKAVEETVKTLLSKLRSDEALSAQLSDIRRAGKAEHYLVIAEKLNLQDWLCARCGRPMVQPRVGRPRKTCSDSCRVALSLANGHGWKDAEDRVTSASRRPDRPANPAEGGHRRASLALTAQEAQAMRMLLREITGRGSRWGTTRDYVARNKALMLLGFTCPVQLSPRDLADFTVDDAIFTGKGLEIRLGWGKNKATARRYATVPPDEDPDLCPVRAMRAWRYGLSRAGCRSGPLFPRMAYWDALKSGRPGMGSRVIASEINHAVYEERPARRMLSESDLLPSFLREIASKMTNTKTSADGHYLGRS